MRGESYVIYFNSLYNSFNSCNWFINVLEKIMGLLIFTLPLIAGLWLYFRHDPPPIDVKNLPKKMPHSIGHWSQDD